MKTAKECPQSASQLAIISFPTGPLLFDIIRTSQDSSVGIRQSTLFCPLRSWWQKAWSVCNDLLDEQLCHSRIVICGMLQHVQKVPAQR